MLRRVWPLLAVAGVLAVAGCSADKEQTPTGLELKVTPPPPYSGCDFSTVKSLITSYFPPPYQQTAQGFESLMESTDAAVRRTNGFAVMDLIGQVSRSTSPGSTTTGSSLTKALTKCMFDTTNPEYTSLAGGNGLDAVLFENALSPATGGVYYVVGAGYDFNTTTDFPNVLKGTVGGTFSGNGNYKVTGGTRNSAVGPATLSGGSYVLGSSWATLLSGNTDEEGRALVYGYQTSTGTQPLEYEWATIKPFTTFDPYALVSICEGTATTLMVHESGVGVLAFSTADLCNSSDATGTATGFRSKFSNQDVTTLNVIYKDAPPSLWKLSTQPNPISVYVSVGTQTTSGVFGVCMYLTGTNNNGQFLNFTTQPGPAHDPACLTPPVAAPYLSVKTKASSVSQTLADFGNVSISKTGTLTLTVTADVIDRSGSGVLASKISVKP
jgi:hypothetical protein